MAVSILVLVDLAHECPQLIDFLVLISTVSILVLVDLAHELRYPPGAYTWDLEFQSLF